MLEQFHPVAIHELSICAKGNGFTGVQRVSASVASIKTPDSARFSAREAAGAVS